MLTKEQITDWFKSLQDDICQQLETADGGGNFREDIWKRDGGGGGRSRIFHGQVIEKGGVNFSAVHGSLPDKIKESLKVDAGLFYATGVSIVLHTHNPFVPIIHMNVRYFEMPDKWWFGGGIDLTPHYINKEEATVFHQKLKASCDKHNPSHYPIFKNWADDYFYIKHRQETRGVGGIFFDHLNDKDGTTKEQRFEFVKEIGNTFCRIYLPLMSDNKNKPFTEENKKWQLLRRSRYVEFNLVWDRGTRFGLDTNGRTESILMSMPPDAKWVYDFQVEKGSEEEKTQLLLKKGIEWV